MWALLLLAAALLLLAAPVLPQSLRVVSEFQRIDPFGEVVPADRTAHPREIISPGVACNGFASFHIAVTVPPREPFFLYVATNPANVFQISLYEELYVKTDNGWIPDVLEPAKVPAFAILPYLPMPIEGQTTVSYWMDVWVPLDMKPQRVRLEVLLKVGRCWMQYPMEIRVLPAVMPSFQDRHTALPSLTARADASVIGPFRDFLCHARENGKDERLTVRRLIHRNALQEMALARLLETRRHSGDLRAGILRLRLPDREAWCRSPMELNRLDSEWFLRVRDLLHREAGLSPQPGK